MNNGATGPCRGVIFDAEYPLRDTFYGIVMWLPSNCNVRVLLLP